MKAAHFLSSLIATLKFEFWAPCKSTLSNVCLLCTFFSKNFMFFCGCGMWFLLWLQRQVSSIGPSRHYRLQPENGGYIVDWAVLLCFWFAIDHNHIGDLFHDVLNSPMSSFDSQTLSESLMWSVAGRVDQSFVINHFSSSKTMSRLMEFLCCECSMHTAACWWQRNWSIACESAIWWSLLMIMLFGVLIWLVMSRFDTCRWEDFKLSGDNSSEDRVGGVLASSRRSVGRQDSIRTKTSVLMPLVQKTAVSTPPEASAPAVTTPIGARTAWLGDLPPSYPHSQASRSNV